LTNTSSSPATTVYVATLPVGFSAISCASPTGSCVIGTGTLVSPANDLDGLRRKSNPFAASASQTVTWSGTIPGNGSVTITYQVQVGVQATSGTQYCVTSTIGGASRAIELSDGQCSICRAGQSADLCRSAQYAEAGKRTDLQPLHLIGQLERRARPRSP
jgi:hypothetical protein